VNIARVHIENLRSISTLDLDLVAPDGLPRRRLVLLGGNGCGKTTTLLAIAHLLGQVDSDFGSERMGAGDVRQLGSDQPSLSPSPSFPAAAIAIQVKLSKDERTWLERVMPQSKPPEHATLQASLGGSPRDAERQHRSIWLLSQTADADATLPKWPGRPARDVERHEQLGWRIGAPAVAGNFGHVDPRIPQWLTQDPAGGERAHEVMLRTAILAGSHPPGVFLPADRGTLQEFEDVSLASLSEFKPRTGCLSPKRDRFQVIPSLLALAFMAPAVNDRDGVIARMWKVLAKYFPEMPRPVEVRGLRLHFKTPAGAIVDFPRLSDGQRAVLLILGELALRNPAGGIVLIDELEQHLHPRWQRFILDALVALLPDAQFIITTQAPYLAASAPDDVTTIGDWTRDGAH
jgi:energy-coupling factor transporter ATP-binding protein EcfA2